MLRFVNRQINTAEIPPPGGFSYTERAGYQSKLKDTSIRRQNISGRGLLCMDYIPSRGIKRTIARITTTAFTKPLDMDQPTL
jgi:hypothetical protein